MRSICRIDRWALAIGGVFAVACGGGDNGTGPGNGGTGGSGGTTANAVYDMTLASPNSDDAGVMFVVSGGTVDSVTAPAGAVAYTMPVGGNVRVVLGGNIHPGSLGTIWMHGTPSSPPVVTIEQAAQANTYAARQISGYTVTVAKR